MELLRILLGVFVIIIIVAFIFLITVIKDDIRRKRKEKIEQEYRKTERHIERLLNAFNQSVAVDLDSLEPLMDIILTNNKVLESIPNNQVYETFGKYLITDNYEIKEEHILYKRKYSKGKAIIDIEDIVIEGYFTEDNKLIHGQFKTIMNDELEVFRIYKPDGMYKVVHEGAYKEFCYRPYARTIFIGSI